MIKRLAFYDMDGTLMDTPHPEDGKVQWEKVNGEKYPYEGWWGKAESLDLDVFDIKPFPSVLSQLKDDTARPDTYTVLLTSRVQKLLPQIQKILQKHGIKFNDLSLKNGSADKGDRIKNYINKFPDVKEISVFDDRKKELDILRSLKSEIGDDVTVNIYQADNGKLSLTESFNKITSIIFGAIVEFDKKTKDNRIYSKTRL